MPIGAGSQAHPTRTFIDRGTGILPVADIAARYQMLTTDNWQLTTDNLTTVAARELDILPDKS